MGLRVSEGIDTQRFTALNGTPLDHRALEHLREIGMTEMEGTRLRATRRGRTVLNAVITELLP
ncbi:coproporphyrinogen III oxidase [Roseovarius tolerans]|uniref:Coproporphyrinogen III oxidase n=2 Tax=Roseovarius tolerans TaxID=74031 RepID=A0A0L6CQ87_9RHOB|nr:coproporphyrinogen III oxidase [Roseovarius tolerans]